eukprot:CAMPEP_0117422960 /NCGR_PEP_ID=MMETSP0758-20121206/3708_1 /TAXON_ID=63605 /ORGANISM="Percolomonas cosmopolitus, Strain AE-1 (ATCC 50343)" /LENGTH=411 /DNA_ID=CAMNT_0005205919 /DNA_START=146 /DNA_END=1378 /DNA_ORIENTATION=-
MNSVIQITIHTCGGLEKMRDFFSKIDPYVQIIIDTKEAFEKGGKKYKAPKENIKRTTTKKKSTNPQWNETFSFPLTNAQQNAIRFKLFDKDLITKDDVLGTLDITLENLVKNKPEKFEKEMIPTKKKNKITLHYTLEWKDYYTKEEEDSKLPTLDEPETVIITPKKKEAEVKTTINAKAKVEAETKAKKEAEAKAEAEAEAKKEAEAKAKAEAEAKAKAEAEAKAKKEAEAKSKAEAKAKIAIAGDNTKVEKKTEVKTTSDNTKKAKKRKSPDSQPNNTVVVKVLKATNIKGDLLSKADVYVKLSLDKDKKQTFKTKTIKSNSNPEWNESFTFQISNIDKQSITIQSFDDDMFKDDKLSSDVIQIKDLLSSNNTIIQKQLGVGKKGLLFIDLSTKLTDPNATKEETTTPLS